MQFPCLGLHDSMKQTCVMALLDIKKRVIGDNVVFIHVVTINLPCFFYNICILSTLINYI